MSLPNFTAEATLYMSARSYWTHGVGTTTGGAIVPQLPRQSLLECLSGCYNPGYGEGPAWNFQCRDDCFQSWESTPQSGPPHPPTQYCRPKCGPCTADPESSLGGSRVCVTRDCDTTDTPCRLHRR